MKKEVKKLRLSRETLQPLTRSDAQKVVGATCSECTMSPNDQCGINTEGENCGTA